MSEVERSESKATSSKDSGWTQARTLNTPEARRYCEWSLLVNDLKYALRRAEMWRDMVPSDAGDVGDIEISVSASVLQSACYNSLQQYARGGWGCHPTRRRRVRKADASEGPVPLDPGHDLETDRRSGTGPVPRGPSPAPPPLPLSRSRGRRRPKVSGNAGC